MTLCLTLLRHGQIKANRTGHWHGSTDSTLTWLGRRQAKRTGTCLSRKGQVFDAVYSSPLKRCRKTAELVQRDADVIEAPEFAEMSIGEYEGMSFRDLETEHGLLTKLNRDPHFEPEGGESIARVAARVCEGLRRLHDQHTDDERILIVSHGVAIGTAIANLLNNDPSRWRDYQIDNCALADLYLEPTPVVQRFNYLCC